YRDLEAPLRQALSAGVPLLGLSASLPAAASQAWMSRFTPSHLRVEASLGRENLHLRVVPLERERERWLWLLEALRGLRKPDSALVYCFSREETDDVARWLRSAGIPAVAFHAGLPTEERSERTRAFRAGHLRVICATAAFGMGIDYPFVARVIHFSMPRDLESYWQEVGRAGRSGQPANGIALWRRSEIARSRILSREGREKFFSLWSAWASGRCRKVVVAEQLGLAQAACGKCDRCLDTRICAWWARPEAELPSWVSERKFSDAEVKRTLGTAAPKSF
ncbi:MAG: helicase-related protein, partial [Bdellovibrionota bacterium]